MKVGTGGAALCIDRVGPAFLYSFARQRGSKTCSFPTRRARRRSW